MRSVLATANKYISSSVIISYDRKYATLKRFYKNVNVLHSEGQYEISLDNRKLKTPRGSLFLAKSEPLAIAVATEWDAQKEKIVQSQMHLTALCSTALDNPNNLNKYELVNYLLNYLPTDTILFHSQAEKELYDLQSAEWSPVIQWFNKRYETNLETILDLSTPHVCEDDKMKITKYLLSHDEKLLHGFVFAVDTLKSCILAFAAIERFLDIDKAVHLARLEEEYQLGYWGRVEWAHDFSQQELLARLSASVLFIQCNRSDYVVKEKLIP